MNVIDLEENPLFYLCLSLWYLVIIVWKHTFLRGKCYFTVRKINEYTHFYSVFCYLINLNSIVALFIQIMINILHRIDNYIG